LSRPPDRSWSWSWKSVVKLVWMGSSSCLPTDEFCNPEYRCRGMVPAWGMLGSSD
jgi:hypothetical protein